MLNVKKDGYRKMLTIVGILLLFSEISERNVYSLPEKEEKDIFCFICSLGQHMLTQYVREID